MSAILETIKVRPKEGKIVRDPITREPIPADGVNVPLNVYWTRRILFKEVDVVSNVKEKKSQETDQKVEETEIKEVKKVKKKKNKSEKGDE